MKRILSIAAAVLILAGASVVALAGEVVLLGGTPYPHGRTGAGTLAQKKGGIELGAGYSQHLWDSLSVRLEASYRTLPNAVEFPWLSSLRMMEGSVNFLVRANDTYKIVPYLLLGAGFAQISQEVDKELRMTFTSYEGTMRLGGGLDYPASDRVSVFVEGFAWGSKYVSLTPVRAGVKIGF